MTALIEFAYHEHATAFMALVEKKPLLLTSEKTGEVVKPSVFRPTTPSYPLAGHVLAGIELAGKSRVLVVKNLPPRAIWPFLVEMNLYGSRGVKDIVNIEYRWGGNGELTIELSSIRTVDMAIEVLASESGFLRRALLGFDVKTSYAKDPCQRPIDTNNPWPSGTLDVPQSVKDPEEFFTRAEFQTAYADVPPLKLPDPQQLVKSEGHMKTPLHPEDFSIFSPRRETQERNTTEHRWTHYDPESGAKCTRLTFGWEYTLEDWWKAIVHRYLETEDVKWQAVLDLYFEATETTNMRRLIAYGKAKGVVVPGPANLWGILRTNA